MEDTMDQIADRASEIVRHGIATHHQVDYATALLIARVERLEAHVGIDLLNDEA